MDAVAVPTSSAERLQCRKAASCSTRGQGCLPLRRTCGRHHPLGRAEAVGQRHLAAHALRRFRLCRRQRRVPVLLRNTRHASYSSPMPARPTGSRRRYGRTRRFAATRRDRFNSRQSRRHGRLHGGGRLCLRRHPKNSFQRRADAAVVPRQKPDRPTLRRLGRSWLHIIILGAPRATRSPPRSNGRAAPPC